LGAVFSFEFQVSGFQFQVFEFSAANGFLNSHYERPGWREESAFQKPPKSRSLASLVMTIRGLESWNLKLLKLETRNY